MKALNQLHNMGPKIVVITSTSFGDNKDKEIVLYASFIKEGRKEQSIGDVLKVVIPILGKDKDPNMTGTGDLLMAMLLAQTELYPNDLSKAIEVSVNIVH